MINNAQINGKRLWDSLMEMAQIGATANDGCNRQALTDQDKIGRELFINWCREAGCQIRTDAIGNIFARRSGTDNTRPPVITGSHLDTQPTGGKFDGIYGVLAGLEVIRTLNDHSIETLAPVEAVVWTNEEGCRFPCAMMGSAVWTNQMPLEVAYGLTDQDGVSVHQELERIGQLGSTPATHFPVTAAFELHIEQGPVLEAEGKTIGVVTGVQNMCRYQVTITGQEAHAGPTPMVMRRDPMMALSDLLPKLFSLAKTYEPDSRLTVGFIQAEPGSPNTVPGKLTFTVDIRHPDNTIYAKMKETFQQITANSGSDYSVDLQTQCIWEAPGVSFDQNCVNAVQNAADQLKYDNMQIVSGAGHDSCNISSVVPTSMIFIPCRDGLSHNESEYASPQHIEAGCNTLLHSIIETAS